MSGKKQYQAAQSSTGDKRDGIVYRDYSVFVYAFSFKVMMQRRHEKNALFGSFIMRDLNDNRQRGDYVHYTYNRQAICRVSTE